MSSRIAFVMGSNGPSWTEQLQFAEVDAERLASCLATHCGFETKAPSKESDAYDVLREFDATADSCKCDDDFVVYFSGHGELSQGALVLLWHTTTESLTAGLAVSHISDRLRACRARRKLLRLFRK